MADYIVKRGDTLWGIASTFGSRISGNTINAKIDTLVSVNGIKNRNLIYVGQEINFSNSGNTSSSAAASTTPIATAPTVTGFGLKSTEESGDTKNRAMFATWKWDRTSTTKCFKAHWQYYDPDMGQWVLGVEQETSSADEWNCYHTYSAPESATKVRFWVMAVSATYTEKDSSGNNVEKQHFTDATWSAVKEYDFSNNPPLTPPVPDVQINTDTLVLTASISNIVASELDAVGVKFNIVQDNSVSLGDSDAITIDTTSNYVAYQYTVTPGHTYTVRACTVAANGKTSGWSDFSGSEGTQPSAPTDLSVRRDTHVDEENDTQTYSVFLEWSSVPNATHYAVEYTNVKSNFDTAGVSVSSESTEDSTPSIRIGISSSDLGYTYYFRVKAVNEDGTSDPSDIVELPIGVLPGPPSTWSTSDSAFVGESMELNWIHNPTDNSKQTYAQIALKINDAENWDELEVMVNQTDANDTEEVTKKYTYGTAVSYKGNLYFKMDTNHPDLENAKVQWKVRTAGVTDILSNDSWSVERTIYIYEKPTLGISMTSDMAGTGSLITTLNSFPFYIRGNLSLTDYSIQRPVGYHVQIISNNYYVTVDDVGRTKNINPGDAVYSKYFNTSSNPLVVEMSANNVDLESGIDYTVCCTADMSTGLSVYNQYDFIVSWVDIEYAINADISIDTEAYTALITPYCREKIPTVIGEGDDSYTTYEDGDLVENVTLSVYRREYDGSYKEIATGIPNNNTAVTDPHPALDYARYRFTAKDTRTGALSFWDMPGYPVNGSAVILQWAETWSTFDAGNSTATEGPSWSGSLLRLPYNIKVTDKRKSEVSLVKYAGRKYPVGYYGTQVDETSQWSVEIPKDDKDTIYALRRLSLWSGDVYVREPSGMGYWANVTVSFNQSYDDVKIPISLDITRVEGGV